jgi:hypothetical protein
VSDPRAEQGANHELAGAGHDLHSESEWSYARPLVATHLILERSHHRARLIGTFRNRIEAEAARGGLIHDNPAWEERLSVVSYDPDERSIAIRPIVISIGEDRQQADV